MLPQSGRSSPGARACMGALACVWLVFACPACSLLIEKELSEREAASGGADGSGSGDGSGGGGAKVDGAAGQMSTATGSTTDTTTTDTSLTTTTTGSTAECTESADCSLAHATAICTTGTCVIVSCSNDFADCNDDPGDGCEADLRHDDDNCGECHEECWGGKHCKKGHCK